MQIATITEDKIQKEVNELKLNQEKTWKWKKSFFDEDGKLIKTQQSQMYIKKTAGTLTIKASVIIKDKDGKEMDGGGEYNYEGVEGWGNAISNWFKSWIK